MVLGESRSRRSRLSSDKYQLDWSETYYIGEIEPGLLADNAGIGVKF